MSASDETDTLIITTAVISGIAIFFYFYFPPFYISLSKLVLTLQAAMGGETSAEILSKIDNLEASKKEIMMAVAPHKMWGSLLISLPFWFLVYLLCKRMGFDLLASGKISVDEIKHLQAQQFKLTSVTLGQNLLNEPYFSGKWRFPYSPVEYLLVNKAVKVIDENGEFEPLEYIIDEKEVLMDYDLSKSPKENRFMDDEVLEELQKQQLGKMLPHGKKPFVSLVEAGEEYEAMIVIILVSVYYQKESAEIIKHIAGAFTKFAPPCKSTLFQEYKQIPVNSMNLRKALVALPFRGSTITSRQLIKDVYQGKQKEMIDKAMGIHFYYKTAYLGLLMWGDTMGLPLEGGYHIWLRPFNYNEETGEGGRLDLHLATSDLGRAKPHAEVAFLYSHFLFENVAKVKGGVPKSPINRISESFSEELRVRGIIE